MIQMIIHRILPGFEDPQSYSSTFLIHQTTLIASYIANCLTFYETLLYLPAIHIVFYYFQLRVETVTMFSEYDCTVLSETDAANMLKQRMSGFSGLVFLLCVYTYLTQRAFITMVIKNHMTAR